MAGLGLNKALFGLAVLLMPFSYATKLWLGLPALIWVDPTLLLALLLLLLIGRLACAELTLALIFLVGLSAAIGGALLGSGLYDALREPLRLALNLIWFSVAVWFLRRHRAYAVNALALSVLLQFAVAVGLWLVLNGLLPNPGLDSVFVEQFRNSQRLFLAGFSVQRLLGSFAEGPPFGLFMFCGLVVLLVASLYERRRGWLVKAGLLAALAGAIGSLADQVLLALLVVAALMWFPLLLRRRTLSYALLGALVIVVLPPYALDKLAAKWDEARAARYSQVQGTSGGERAFHARYSAEILQSAPAALPLGIGPGRYGDYAAATGLFPDTVNIQTTAVEWLVEYGLVGASILLLWVALVAYRAGTGYGVLGVAAVLGLLIANGFQANWKWEAWFFALAFFYSAGGRTPGTVLRDTRTGPAAATHR